MKQKIFFQLKRMLTGIAAGAFAFVWWGVLYPELCFPQDTYDIMYEMEEEEISGDDMCRQLLWADEEQIIVTSRLLQWIKQHKQP